MWKRSIFLTIAVLVCLSLYGTLQIVDAAQYKVMIVMSYHEGFTWCKQLKEGLDSVLASQAELKYVYLDAREHPDNLKANAELAYKEFEAFQPNGVIAADDEAQVGFVLPYLKDKVEIPIIFCGVNETAEKYGYPAKNITGMLQRPHFLESVIFLQQLVPSVKTLGGLFGDTLSMHTIAQQFQNDVASSQVKLLEFKFVKTMEQAVAAAKELEGQTDAIFVGGLSGLTGASGSIVVEQEAIGIIAKAYGKPTVTAWKTPIAWGFLCGVAERPQEQGATTAEMLIKALTGTPIADIPITQNKRGARVLNTVVMQSLGIQPKPAMLKGVELVGGGK